MYRVEHFPIVLVTPASASSRLSELFHRINKLISKGNVLNNGSGGHGQADGDVDVDV